MPKFTKIPTETFKQIAINAGLLLANFKPADGTYEDEDIIGATSGGINVTCVPTFSDYGEDIDNCPKNMLDLKKIDGWEVKASGTMVTVDQKGGKRLLAAADIDGSDTNKIAPRLDLKKTDFSDLWIVADYSDVDGGCVAIHILNALSTGGFSIQTADKGKGKFAFEFTGHVSMDAQDVVPFELYVKAGTVAE